LRVNLDVVVILAEFPIEILVGGQVGTVIGYLDDISALVELSDESGRGYGFLAIHNSLLFHS
jgi:hypothetical protein